MTTRNQKGFLKSLALLELGIFEVVFVGIVIAFILMVLNFFNIISLSTLYPDKLGFLPHRPISQTAQTREGTSGAFLVCPVKSDPCEGEQVMANGKYIGMGFAVPGDFGFYAAIPGTAIFKSENVEGSANHVNIGGSGVALGYEAIYDYIGPPSSTPSATVVQGDLLGRVENGALTQGKNGNINLLFKFLGPNGANIELKSSDFIR